MATTTIIVDMSLSDFSDAFVWTLLFGMFFTFIYSLFNRTS